MRKETLHQLPSLICPQASLQGLPFIEPSQNPVDRSLGIAACGDQLLETQSRAEDG